MTLKTLILTIGTVLNNREGKIQKNKNLKI